MEDNTEQDLKDRMKLSGIYEAADQASGRGQKTYLALSAIRLLSLLVASIAGAMALAIREADWFGWIVLLAFFLAGVSEVLLIAFQPERNWYSGRAIAESTKTLAWRYAVGAQPFVLTLTEEEADSLLRERISQVVDKGKDRLDLGLNPSIITPAMKQLRCSSFEVRRDTYRKLRTQDQREWYSNKAKSNATRATGGRYALLICEFGAVVAAALAIQSERLVDFAGILAALVASGAAWLSIKQYSQLASAYRMAAIELVIQEDVLTSATEDKWSQAVADAEEAISREHTMWLASRGSEHLPGAE